jgi:[ribosomal protein S5]-alanine N-acetyltransferase
MRRRTPRLTIRTFEERDGESWLALVSDPDVLRYLPPSTAPVTIQTFRAALEQRRAMERDHRYAIWAVEEAATGAFIGQCGLRTLDQTHEIELAYHYVPGSWNKGYGTEAATAVLIYGFEELGLNRVIALVMAENVGSCRVAEKSGMRFEGLVSRFGLEGLRKYSADREWRRQPTEIPAATRVIGRPLSP